MRIGYGKIGRSWNLDPKKASTVGGDLDVQRGLARIAHAFPQDTIVLIGRNSGEDPKSLGYPDNIENPWHNNWKLPAVKDWDSFINSWRTISADVHVDALVLWVGQHGSSNMPIPQIGSDWSQSNLTNPQISALNYGSYLLEFANRTGLEPILLVPDPRNYIKCRDLTNPLVRPVLAQYRMTREMKHERFGASKPTTKAGRMEQSVFVTTAEYEYAGIELTALALPSRIPFNSDFDSRQHAFGLISNENRVTKGRFDRLPLIKEWVLRYNPDAPLYGDWSEESEAALGRKVESVDALNMVPTLQSFRVTATFPASSSGWATAKPWEAFAAGTPIIFHPKYDEQGHILPLRNGPTWSAKDLDAVWLSSILRVATPTQMQATITRLNTDRALWQEVVLRQHAYFNRAFAYWQGGVRRIVEEIKSR